MPNTDELEERRLALTKLLFSTPRPENISWSDIQGEIEALTYQYDATKEIFKRIYNENELGTPIGSLSVVAGQIKSTINRMDSHIDDLTEEIKELEDKLKAADQSQAIFNLFSDLGFDITCLKDPMDPSKLVDITESSVVNNLKSQMNRIKP